MRAGTALVPSKDGTRHERVEVRHIETADDLYALREDVDFHEGALSILNLASAPQGFLSHDTPRMYGGIRFLPGAYITKDEAGNFGFLRDEKGFIPA